MSNNLLQLKVIIWNANSIRHKAIETFNFLKLHHISICLITETWLTNLDTLYSPDYKIYRVDRKNYPNHSSVRETGHGGVCILVKNNIYHKLLPNIRLNVIEAIGVSVRTEIGDISFISAYFPGSTNPDKLRLFKSDIQSLINYTKLYFIGGDFNS